MRFSLFSILLFIGAGLSACSFGLQKTVHTSLITVDKRVEAHIENSLDTLIAPFKEKLALEMNEKIAVAEVDFINERMNGNLGNLVSSVLLKEAHQIQNDSLICVLNFGGLRSTLNKGDILLGDVYKLLPFDNYLVLILLKKEATEGLKKWILSTGGQPIAGFYIEDGELLDQNKQKWKERDCWIVTSDYLLNGGDHADFFKENLQVIQTDLLLRDVFLKGIKNQSIPDYREERIIQH